MSDPCQVADLFLDQADDADVDVDKADGQGNRPLLAAIKVSGMKLVVDGDVCVGKWLEPVKSRVWLQDFWRSEAQIVDLYGNHEKATCKILQGCCGSWCLIR